MKRIRARHLLIAVVISVAFPGRTLRAQTPNLRPRLLTPGSELPSAQFLDIEIPNDGYLAVFELRPGAGLGMVFPPRSALEKENDGSISQFRGEELWIEEGVRRVSRPAKGRPLRSGNIQTTRNDWDLSQFPYYCGSGPRSGTGSSGRWLLVVWSKEELDLTKLWGSRNDQCGANGAEDQALAVVERIAGLNEPRPWVVELVRY